MAFPWLLEEGQRRSATPRGGTPHRGAARRDSRERPPDRDVWGRPQHRGRLDVRDRPPDLRVGEEPGSPKVGILPTLSDERHPRRYQPHHEKGRGISSLVEPFPDEELEQRRRQQEYARDLEQQIRDKQGRRRGRAHSSPRDRFSSHTPRLPPIAKQPESPREQQIASAYGYGDPRDRQPYDPAARARDRAPERDKERLDIFGNPARPDAYSREPGQYGRGRDVGLPPAPERQHASVPDLLGHAPPYQPYQPSGYQPAFQPPLYQQPAYQQPQYQAPAYQAPAYQAPAYQAPAYQPPAYQPPSYAKPSQPAPYPAREAPYPAREAPPPPPPLQDRWAPNLPSAADTTVNSSTAFRGRERSEQRHLQEQRQQDQIALQQALAQQVEEKKERERREKQREADEEQRLEQRVLQEQQELVAEQERKKQLNAEEERASMERQQQQEYDKSQQKAVVRARRPQGPVIDIDAEWAQYRQEHGDGPAATLQERASQRELPAPTVQHPLPDPRTQFSPPRTGLGLGSPARAPQEPASPPKPKAPLPDLAALEAQGVHSFQAAQVDAEVRSMKEALRQQQADLRSQVSALHRYAEGLKAQQLKLLSDPPAWSRPQDDLPAAVHSAQQVLAAASASVPSYADYGAFREAPAAPPPGEPQRQRTRTPDEKPLAGAADFVAGHGGFGGPAAGGLDLGGEGLAAQMSQLSQLAASPQGSPLANRSALQSPGSELRGSNELLAASPPRPLPADDEIRRDASHDFQRAQAFEWSRRTGSSHERTGESDLRRGTKDSLRTATSRSGNQTELSVFSAFGPGTDRGAGAFGSTFDVSVSTFQSKPSPRQVQIVMPQGALARREANIDSEEVGHLPCGAVVEVVAQRQVDGRERLRVVVGSDLGWISERTGGGALIVSVVQRGGTPDEPVTGLAASALDQPPWEEKRPSTQGSAVDVLMSALMGDESARARTASPGRPGSSQRPRDAPPSPSGAGTRTAAPEPGPSQDRGGPGPSPDPGALQGYYQELGSDDQTEEEKLQRYYDSLAKEFPNTNLV